MVISLPITIPNFINLLLRGTLSQFCKRPLALLLRIKTAYRRRPRQLLRRLTILLLLPFSTTLLMMALLMSASAEYRSNAPHFHNTNNNTNGFPRRWWQLTKSENAAGEENSNVYYWLVWNGSFARKNRGNRVGKESGGKSRVAAIR